MNRNLGQLLVWTVSDRPSRHQPRDSRPQPWRSLTLFAERQTRSSSYLPSQSANVRSQTGVQSGRSLVELCPSTFDANSEAFHRLARLLCFSDLPRFFGIERVTQTGVKIQTGFREPAQRTEQVPAEKHSHGPQSLDLRRNLLGGTRRGCRSRDLASRTEQVVAWRHKLVFTVRLVRPSRPSSSGERNGLPEEGASHERWANHHRNSYETALCG